MQVLFLTNSFNGMAQRLWIELDWLNHQVHLQVVSKSDDILAGVEKYQPDLIIAPFLTHKIPATVWKKYTCLIVHPGIKGDRGASSLDWAVLNQASKWGVTILEAAEKMDGGAVWATHEFDMRDVSKSELYRGEVTQAAAKGILAAIANFQNGSFKPAPLNCSASEIKGKWNRSIRQADIHFSWHDDTTDIIRKIRSADSSPGVLIALYDREFYCFGAHPESKLKGAAGKIIAQRNGAICIATDDAALWLTHLKSVEKGGIKLPAVRVLGTLLNDVDEIELSPFDTVEENTWQEIKFIQEEAIGYIHFDFYNGAMSTAQCNRLRNTLSEAKSRNVKLIVLMGGKDVWSNGIHLNIIENAKNPADESWENINAIDDLILEIIESTDHYIIASLQGNAGAGGVSLALAADKVVTRNGIVINPHTRNMGLYGSEYWTYLLPKRIGIDKANKFTNECLPWGVEVAKEIGLIDDYYGENNTEFVEFVKKQAQEIVNLSYFDKLILAKKMQRRKDERNKPLANYRKEELAKMRANFYDNDLDYNYKRFCLVHKLADENSQQVKDLYSSRREIYRKRKWESIEYGK
jgi:putative two-component system hydrogenase maturation factor HypX/HoxX